ncbi:hypothetical protein DAPPUDRAFT_326886 [Daphnia pulex]|uniref:Uncharacterized protein n=1 Tax=Daphnia pulex TaxID=6669 RepID=E9H931_DAPPU|nr:hypothetical protein DAPPUDRAFT_326886 [Daphnia pulex]|eukprot:EFX71768.1 hypothetical protein DAPPUDRAFT_326886 [Daphnia pulex]
MRVLNFCNFFGCGFMHNSADSACALPTVSNESGEQVLELINELDEKQNFLELTLDTFEVSEESPNLDYDDAKFSLKRKVEEERIEFAKKAKLDAMNCTYIFHGQDQQREDGGDGDDGEGDFDSSGDGDYGDDGASDESSLCSSMSNCTTESEPEDKTNCYILLCGYQHHSWSEYYDLHKTSNNGQDNAAVPEDDEVKGQGEAQKEGGEQKLIDDEASSQSSSSTDEVSGKRKKSLQTLKDAKRLKKLEKRNLQTVDSDDDLGDLTDSFSSRCSSHDSDAWEDDWDDDLEKYWD